MQKEIDPKLVGGLIALVVLLVGGFMFIKFRTPADFAGPPVKIKAPRGFAIPVQGSVPGVQQSRLPPAGAAPPQASGGMTIPGQPR